MPDSLPITKPLLPSHTSLLPPPPPSTPAGLPTTGTVTHPPQPTAASANPEAAANSPDHGGSLARLCETAPAGVMPSGNDRLQQEEEEEGAQGSGGALRGVAPAAYTTLQAVGVLACTHRHTHPTLQAVHPPPPTSPPPCCTAQSMLRDLACIDVYLKWHWGYCFSTLCHTLPALCWHTHPIAYIP